MNDKLYYYEIKWKQAYDNWPSREWLDAAEQAILESKVESSNLQEANALLSRIKQL